MEGIIQGPSPVVITETKKVPIGIQIAAALVLIPLGMGALMAGVTLLSGYSVAALFAFLLLLATFIAGWGILSMKRWPLLVVAIFELLGNGVLLYKDPVVFYDPFRLTMHIITIAGLIIGWFSMRHIHHPPTPTNPNPTNPTNSANPIKPTNTHSLGVRVALALIIIVLLAGIGTYVYTKKSANPANPAKTTTASSILKPGIYKLEGYNSLNGGPSYQGQVYIRQGEDDAKGFWLLQWGIGEGQDQRGLGILNNGVLSVGYFDATGGTINDSGVVSYTIIGDGKLEGKWASTMSSEWNAGLEKLTWESDLPNPEELGSAQSKARDAVRIADIAQIRLALELYANKHDKYPANLNEYLEFSNFSSNPEKKPWADPLTLKPYLYALCGGKDYVSSNYHLGANLENSDAANLQSDDDKQAVCSADKINGDDSSGCDGQKGLYCYDFTAQ